MHPGDGAAETVSSPAGGLVELGGPDAVPCPQAEAAGRGAEPHLQGLRCDAPSRNPALGCQGQAAPGGALGMQPLVWGPGGTAGVVGLSPSSVGWGLHPGWTPWSQCRAGGGRWPPCPPHTPHQRQHPHTQFNVRVEQLQHLWNYSSRAGDHYPRDSDELARADAAPWHQLSAGLCGKQASALCSGDPGTPGPAPWGGPEG